MLIKNNSTHSLFLSPSLYPCTHTVCYTPNILITLIVVRFVHAHSSITLFLFSPPPHTHFGSSNFFTSFTSMLQILLTLSCCVLLLPGFLPLPFPLPFFDFCPLCFVAFCNLNFSLCFCCYAFVLHTHIQTKSFKLLHCLTHTHSVTLSLLTHCSFNPRS